MSDNKKILYHGVYFDYGLKHLWPSYEYYNLEWGLRDFCIRQGWTLQTFHPDQFSPETRWQEFGNLISEFQPDYFFGVNFNEDHDLPENLASLLKKQDCKLIEFHCDPVRRFSELTANRRRFIDYFITTDSRTTGWYQEWYKKPLNVINSQYAISTAYKDWNYIERDIDVSFIGQKYGWREQAINILRKHGVNVQLYGKFWEKQDDSGMISFSEMLEILNRSKIVINFLGTFPGTAAPDQIKGRTFEIPACGACQVSTPAFNLEDYFKNGEEIIICDKITEMAEQIKELLSNDKKRLTIANAGNKRVWDSHTWNLRYQDIFKEIGAL